MTSPGVEALFRGLLEAAPDAVVIVDRGGRIVLVNVQAERLLGYTRDEMVGQPLEMLIPARLRGDHARHRDGFFRDPRTRGMGTALELHAIRKDGTELPVEISLAPIETDDGLLVTSAIRDVTQRRETEHALKAANHELESFSYSIAHDLRAPLRAMNGFAQIILEDYGDRLDADGLDALHEIRKGAVRMGALIDALLSLARLTRSDLRRERVDLAALARSILSRYALDEPTRLVDVVIGDGLWAHSDPEMTRALLENLLGNAWKFTRHVAPARIEVGVIERAEGHTFFVRDNGAGFDMAYAARLFGPFQRLHAEREFPGTGIGLATAQRIVRRHGGRISAEAAVGAGATFYFSFGGPA